MRTLLLIVVVTALSAINAYADGCEKFAWPIKHDLELLKTVNQSANAGDSLSGLPQAAFTLALKKNDYAMFLMQPERKPKAGRAFGAVLHFPAPARPGLYQVTLSDEAWIDIVQNGRFARSVGHSGRADCPGLRKSVRFEIAASPFVLQLSDSESEKIGIVVSEVR